MTARGFDVFDQMAAAAVLPSPTPTVTPTAPRAQATTIAARRTNRPLRAFVCMGAFAVLLLLAAALVTVTPIGRIDADITVPFVAVCVGAVGASAWVVLR